MGADAGIGVGGAAEKGLEGSRVKVWRRAGGAGGQVAVLTGSTGDAGLQSQGVCV